MKRRTVACGFLVYALIGGVISCEEGFALPDRFPVTVLLEGSGTGRVTSDPPGITCGTTCDAFFPRDSIITLTANADSTATFGGWQGSCTGTAPCSLFMTGPKAVAARFVTTDTL